MICRKLLFCAAIVVSTLTAAPTSAQILFQDNFESQPNGDTASVFEGGTPNDPGLGDADPSAPQVGAWGPIFEGSPWHIQVSTATNGPTPGPAPGSTKYLTIERPGGLTSDARGSLASAATGLFSVDFQVQAKNGPMQFFVRGATGGGFSLLPAYFDLATNGAVRMNGALTSLTFDPNSYASIHLLFDMPAQTWSATVNGNSAGNATNRSFVEAVSSIQQISFYASDGGNFGIDNLLVRAVPEPVGASLALISGAGLLLTARRRSGR